MIVLGIDPAIRTTGYGVVEFDGTLWRILDCGVIKNGGSLAHSECVRRLYGGILELVGNFHPDEASMEDPFCGRNASTAIILGMARGAILAALAGAGIATYSYSATKAKKAAVGSGSAAKEQVAMMMSATFGIESSLIPLDATDALALAVCHAQRAFNPELAAMLVNKL